ncbi:DUF1758 domain-containing protein [Trichonephila clavipes]|nr:DUF1758 domain-containing protein [Trichonephila clavipes]
MGKVPRYIPTKKDTSMNIVTMLSQEDIPVSSPNSPAKERWQIRGPYALKVDRAFLTDNYELCLKRLESTTRKLEKIGFREKYHEVFREWLAEGVIEEIPGKELPVRTHYLPHRPVIKETSATSSMKIRPVFDASAKINNHPSLNDCLETGNNLIESVTAILARFRLKPIGVISDIRRAFRQISLHEKDRDFVRFLWYDNEDSFYVDNCVTSVQNNAELRIFVESATNVMKEGMFDLRGWESSAIPSESATSLVLGLIWDKNSDTLEIDSESLKLDEKKR